jgi:hypothetical protein
MWYLQNADAAIIVYSGMPLQDHEKSHTSLASACFGRIILLTSTKKTFVGGIWVSGC